MAHIFCVVKMKKIISKYKNGNLNNPQYSLNYKFDSVSSVGKINGTALELIKKYNELAKEAHSNGNYTEMENFRQYAEHYRKIVTDINERKNNSRPGSQNEVAQEQSASLNEKEVCAENNQENVGDNSEEKEVLKKVAPKRRNATVKKEFKVVEITAQEEKKEIKEEVKKVRTARKKIMAKMQDEAGK